MIVELPLRADLPHYDFSLTLDGVTYLFEFRWNTREECWYFDTRLEDGTDVVLGVKVVVNWPLGKRQRNENALPGIFLARDTSGRKKDPGEFDLGDRVKIFYLDAESAAEWKADLGLG